MKKILAIALVLTMCVSLGACGKNKDDNKTTESTSSVGENSVLQTEESTESTSNLGKLSKAEQAASDFITAVQKEEYEKVLSSLNTDTSFITVEDVKWLLPRTSLSELVGEEEEITNVSSGGGNTSDTVTFEIGPKTVEINVELNNDNEWKVNSQEIYLNDWNVKIPKDMYLTVNEVEVDKKMITSTDERYDIYKIPSVPKKEVKVVASCDKFGDFESNTVPSTEEYSVSCKLSDDKANEIYEQVKTMMNEINETYDNGGRENDDYKKFVSDYATTDFINTLISSVTTQYTWNNSLDPKNIRVTQVLPRTDNEEYKPCFVYTADTIGVNIRVEKSWDEKYTDSSSTRIMGYFVLEQTEDGVKLVNMPASDNLIEQRNSMTHKW